MKALIVNFSISNGGDYLIEKRTNDLIKKSFPQWDIQSISGLKPVSTKVLNSFDRIIVGGGPHYDDRIIRTLFMPLFLDIDNISPSIHILGSGIYGEDCFAESINTRFFADDVKSFLEKLLRGGGSLGCRDILSYIVMKNSGFSSVYLTGCPAWYSLDFLDKTLRNEVRDSKIEKIVVSDPGVTKNADEQDIRAKQAIELIDKVWELFPSANIIFTFNNGIKTKYSHKCNNIINDYLKKNSIPVYELAYDEKKFSIYDDADLHIGFRVHSHIYALSRRIPSILVEEDLRGYGMNETLGLPHLLSYDDILMHTERKYAPNPWLTKQLSDIIAYMKLTSFARIEGAFHIMNEIYHNGYMKWAEMVGTKG